MAGSTPAPSTSGHNSTATALLVTSSANNTLKSTSSSFEMVLPQPSPPEVATVRKKPEVAIQEDPAAPSPKTPGVHSAAPTARQSGQKRRNFSRKVQGSSAAGVRVVTETTEESFEESTEKQETVGEDGHRRTRPLSGISRQEWIGTSPFQNEMPTPDIRRLPGATPGGGKANHGILRAVI